MLSSTYRRFGLLFLASLPLVLLVLVALTCDAQARDRTAYRYCVLSNTAGNRTKVGNCIAAGRCVATSISTIRRSLDNSLGIVKWRVRAGQTGDDIPTAVADICTILTHAQARALMRTAEWTAP